MNESIPKINGNENEEAGLGGKTRENNNNDDDDDVVMLLSINN